MPSNFYDLLKYEKTGIAAPSMSNLDKIRALSLAGGYPLSTITGVPPLTFRADGRQLTAWSIYGNGKQTGAPSPDNIIMPEFCGKLVGSDWTIPITCAGQTVPIYLGQTPTVRMIKKLVLTGEEAAWHDSPSWDYTGTKVYYIVLAGAYMPNANHTFCVCSHYQAVSRNTLWEKNYEACAMTGGGNNVYTAFRVDSALNNIAAWKIYLAAQYAAGTPVTVWYVLATPETGIVNEPLAKIGNYADVLDSTSTGIMIPTVRGSNTLSVGTDVQPSSVSITGHIKLT